MECLMMLCPFVRKGGSIVGIAEVCLAMGGCNATVLLEGSLLPGNRRSSRSGYHGFLMWQFIAGIQGGQL